MIEDPNFSLMLGAGWLRVPSSHPALNIFINERRSVTLRMEATAQVILPGDLDRLAWTFTDREIEKELSSAQARGHDVTIYEPIVAPQPWGRAVAWHGHGTDEQRFSFSGTVTCRCTIGLHLWTPTLTESPLLGLMDDLSSQIAFDRTPLERQGAFH